MWNKAGVMASGGEVLRKAIALYDVAFEAKLQKNRLGILDQNKQILTEIVGL